MADSFGDSQRYQTEEKVENAQRDKCMSHKIADGKENAKSLDEDSQKVVLNDIHPRADHHYLVVTKVHLPNPKVIPSELVECVLTVGTEILEKNGVTVSDSSNNPLKTVPEISKEKKEILCSDKIYKLWDLPTNEKEGVKFLQDFRILPSTKRCLNGHSMKLYFKKNMFWKCNVKNCRKEISIRKGTWLENSKLSIVNIIRFIYLWAYDMSSVKMCSTQLEMNKNTTVDWNNYMRELCVNDLENREKVKIGGKNLLVEVDESLFTCRKNNKGGSLPDQWIFGGICRKTNEVFLEKVPNCSAHVLLDSIRRNIAQGSTVYSDSWKCYDSDELEAAGFSHFKVDHKMNLVDSKTITHTQNRERIWRCVKWRKKLYHGPTSKHLNTYLPEFLWKRTCSKLNPFVSMLNTISEQWSVNCD